MPQSHRSFWKFGLVALAMAALAVVILGMSQRTRPGGHLPPNPIAPTRTSVRLEDGVNYLQGAYLAYAGDWSVRAKGLPLRHGVDYRDVLFIEPDTFPAGTEIHWAWPERPPQAGVYGFMHVAYGYYAGGVPKEEVPSRRIKDIRKLKTHFMISTSNIDGQYNILSETFLTRVSRDFASRSAEVGFLSAVSDDGRIFFDLGRSLGSWTDPDQRVWSVAVQGQYFMFIPAEAAARAATLHFDEAFRWLISKQELTGEEWFNGLAIGAEPVSGSGTMRLEAWDVDYR